MKEALESMFKLYQATPGKLKPNIPFKIGVRVKSSTMHKVDIVGKVNQNPVRIVKLAEESSQKSPGGANKA